MRRRDFLLGLAASLFRSAWGEGNWRALKAYNRAENGVSLLVMQNGQTLLEDETEGSEPGYELASGTKSFWGTLALVLKLNLDEPMGPVLTEWSGDSRGQITVRQLLTLTSGLPGGSIGRPPTFAKALQVTQRFAAGTRFQYGPAPYQCFGEYLRRKYQCDPLELLEKHVLRPAQVQYQDWKRGADGQIHLPSGARLNARNWAKFGLWVLGQQQALAECFKGTPANPAYGLTWWLNRPVDPSIALNMGKAMGQIAELGAEKSLPDIWMAAGAGDQRLYLIPSRNMLIVRQADRILGRLLKGEGHYSDRDFLLLALRPAVTASASPWPSRL
ncbi:MAG: serine hydrolase domain-containing protein [Vulcanimicrobiota bacterium]